MNVHTKFEVRTFTHSRDNRGYSNNSGSPWIRLLSLFSKIFNGLLFGWCLWMYWPNLKSVALLFPEIIAIEVLGGVANPQSWRRGGLRGSGMVLFERALASSYRPSRVTFPLSLRVSEILLHRWSSTPLFPTPPQVSPKFPHVPLGVGGWLWATKSECVGLMVRAVSFQDFQRLWSWTTKISERQTGDMRSQYRALHHSASRGKNTDKLCNMAVTRDDHPAKLW